MRLHTRQILFLIILLALIVRLCMLWSFYRQNPSYFYNDTAELIVQMSDSTSPYLNVFGFEVSNVAYALVCKGEGLANPFGGDTGPTGWAAPGVVMLYALAFALFGCFSAGSILFMYALALCLSAIIIIMIFRVCMCLFKSPKVACTASLLYALDPHDLFIFNRTKQQDFNVFPFFFILCFLLFLRCLHSRSMLDRCLFGLAAGAAILCNPVFVLPVSACCLYYITVNRCSFMRAVRETVVAVLACAFLLAPYILYQYQQLHTWSFVKSNGVFELYLGNIPGSGGLLTIEHFFKYHPSANIDEYREYRDMGETAYIHSKSSVFLDTFDPVFFISRTLKRCVYFFFMFPGLDGSATLSQHVLYSLRGLALIFYGVIFFRRLRSVDVLIYAYIFAYALPFLFMGIMYRYSFPIVPLAAILWARVLWELQGFGKRLKHSRY